MQIHQWAYDILWIYKAHCGFVVPLARINDTLWKYPPGLPFPTPLKGIHHKNKPMWKTQTEGHVHWIQPTPLDPWLPFPKLTDPNWFMNKHFTIQIMMVGDNSECCIDFLLNGIWWREISDSDLDLKSTQTKWYLMPSPTQGAFEIWSSIRIMTLELLNNINFKVIRKPSLYFVYSKCLWKSMEDKVRCSTSTQTGKLPWPPLLDIIRKVLHGLLT